MALLEAMFAARPIVASSVGEIGVALAHGEAGLLVPPADPPSLALAIDRLLREPTFARALGEHAFRRAWAEYHVSHMVGQYVTAYMELLAPRLNSSRF